MADYVATEHSWRLSENFERNCKERSQMNLDEHMDFSLDLRTESIDNVRADECMNCCMVNNMKNGLKPLNTVQRDVLRPILDEVNNRQRAISGGLQFKGNK